MVINRREVSSLVYNKRAIHRVVYNKQVLFFTDSGVYLSLEKSIVNLLFSNNFQDTSMVYTNSQFTVR